MYDVPDPLAPPEVQDEESQVVAPEGIVLRVVCDQGHPLTGLFVIWAEAKPPTSSSGGALDEQILAIANESDPLPNRFVLGIVDKAGYLQPVLDDKNPWRLVAQDSLPHTFKMGAGRTYRFCLLRHPSARLARALTAFLNGKGPFDVNAWGGADAWEGDTLDPEALVREYELELAPPAPPPPASTPPPEAPPPGPEELRLELRDGALASQFWPRGSTLYSGWTLYPDMPGLRCEKVVEAVKRLQWHLAALCYPVGKQETPYWLQPRTERIPTGNLGIFEERTAAALMRFQEHAEEGRAFQVAERALAHGEMLDLSVDPFKHHPSLDEKYLAHMPWHFLAGEPMKPATPGAPAPEPGTAPVPTYAPEARLHGHALGVVDVPTGEALTQWIQRGYRKPDKVLLPVDASGRGIIYLREDAATQLLMWRGLMATFGVDYGLPSGHSFRDITSIARGVKGVLNNSIHKTGMAIDFSIKSTRETGTDYTRPADHFPIRVEQRFDTLSRDPVVAARLALERARKAREDAQAQRAKDAQAQAHHGSTPAPPPPPPRKGRAAPPPPAARAQAPRAPARPPPEPTTGEQARVLAAKAAGAASKARSQALKSERVASRSLAHYERTSELWTMALEADDAHLAALDKEVALREQEHAQLQAENRKVKISYRMRWCMYGHSTLDPSRAADLDGLAQALKEFPVAFRKSLRERFHPSLRDEPAAARWLDTAMKTYAPVARAAALGADLAGANTRPTVVANSFRTSIYPFLPDPLEADGGTSRSEPLAISQDVGQVHPKLTPFTPRPGKPARSYVNVSVLGHLCGMLGIGTAGGGWKRGFVQLQGGKGFATIARMIASAGDHADARVEPILVQRNKSLGFEYSHTELDKGFLLDWVAALQELATVPPAPGARRARPTPSRCIATRSPQVTLTLPVPERKDDAMRLVSQLEGAFGNKSFFVVAAGQKTNLVDLVSAGAQTGRALAARLRSECENFGTERTARAMGRNLTWWQVTLQPVFVKTGTPRVLAEVAFHPTDRVQVASPGEPRTLEWWHYQSIHAQNASWESQVTEVGFSRVMLQASLLPPEQDGGVYDGAGIGYTDKELASPDGGMTSTRSPGNVWSPPPEGW